MSNESTWKVTDIPSVMKKDKENIYGDQGKYMGKNLQGWKKQSY